MTVLGTIKDGIPQLGAKNLKTSWLDNQAPVPDVLASKILQQLPKNDDRARNNPLKTLGERHSLQQTLAPDGLSRYFGLPRR